MLRPERLTAEHDTSAFDSGEPALDDWLRREGAGAQNGRGKPAQLPAVLLGKLAVDTSRQGSGLGVQVFAEAVARVVHLSDEVGFRYLVIDALHGNAATFYEHYSFTRVPTPDALRLVLRVSRRSCGPEGPERAHPGHPGSHQPGNR